VTYALTDEINPDDVPVIPRKEHIRDFARNYKAGQHATFLGPTGRGKTKLAGQLLVATCRAHRNIRASILHGKIKGRDKTIGQLSKQGFPISTRATLSMYQRVRYRERYGHIVRPLTHPEGKADDKLGPTERENEHLRREFRDAIYRGYHAKKKQPVILFIDEAHQAHNDLKLRKDCEGPLMRGRPVCGVWSLVQRGRYVSHMVYDQAEHVYIFYDATKDNQERYAEIGGVDHKLLIALSRRLKTATAPDGSTYSQCIYFRRSGDVLAIVDT
jgi:hypothetical protein